MKISLILFLILLRPIIYANNIGISNIVLTGQNTQAGLNSIDNFTMVKFDISWENSWRISTGPSNWDAAWVFVKYRVGSGNWQHAWLNNSGHVSPAGSNIDIGVKDPGSVFDATINPAIGVFIYRSTLGAGTFSLSKVQLRWNYGANGVQDDDTIDVRVFAIEMVYVPKGSYWLGDGTNRLIRGNFCNGITNNPLLISSEAGITLGGTANGNLGKNDGLGQFYYGDFDSSITQVLPSAFPKGFNAFYGMKYEISQQGYVDFLNTLTRNQQGNRTATPLNRGVTNVTNRYVMSNTNVLIHRGAIRCDAIVDSIAPILFYSDLNGNGLGSEIDDGQWVSNIFMTYMDFSAYLDWSGLRPMTELEFEKSCRGLLYPIPDEYAWGSTSLVKTVSLLNNGSINETSNTLFANACIDYSINTLCGPIRVGAFAITNSRREQAGAGYYGMMELSGNMYEMVVTVGQQLGRLFSGVHGNGSLSISGNADEISWPGLVNGEVTGATGSGARGGDWANREYASRVSDRIWSCAGNWQRSGNFGGRGVRNAP